MLTTLAGSGTAVRAIVDVTPKLSITFRFACGVNPKVITFVKVYGTLTGAIPMLREFPWGFTGSPDERTEYVGVDVALNALDAVCPPPATSLVKFPLDELRRFPKGPLGAVNVVSDSVILKNVSPLAPATIWIPPLRLNCPWIAMPGLLLCPPSALKLYADPRPARVAFSSARLTVP
jgi:hypothetical protein